MQLVQFASFLSQILSVMSWIILSTGKNTQLTEARSLSEGLGSGFEWH